MCELQVGSGIKIGALFLATQNKNPKRVIAFDLANPLLEIYLENKANVYDIIPFFLPKLWVPKLASDMLDLNC